MDGLEDVNGSEQMNVCWSMVSYKDGWMVGWTGGWVDWWVGGWYFLTLA